jgi:hypothetical protein
MVKNTHALFQEEVVAEIAKKSCPSFEKEGG